MISFEKISYSDARVRQHNVLCKTRIPDNKYPNAALRAEGFLFPTEKTMGSLAQV